MASQLSMDQPSFEATKAPPVASTESMLVDTNGAPTQYDALFDDNTEPPLTNGNHLVGNTSEQTNGTNPDLSAPQEEAPGMNPATEVSSGIAPTAPFLPDDGVNGASIESEPVTTISQPPPVEQPTSDLRDTALPVTQPIEEQASEVPVEAAPEETQLVEETQLDAMDTTGDDVAAVSAREGDGSHDPPITANNEPTAESLPETVAETVNEPAQQEDTEMLNADQSDMPIREPLFGDEPPAKATSSGQVRQREDDDEAEPSAKRARTQEREP
ncbi:hypothetical protein LTS18_013568, partial [Coniosporium uncinatum]